MQTSRQRLIRQIAAVLIFVAFASCSGEDPERDKFEQRFKEAFADEPWIERVEVDLLTEDSVYLESDLKQWEEEELAMAIDACEGILELANGDPNVQVQGEYILRKEREDINGDSIPAETEQGVIVRSDSLTSCKEFT